MYTSIAPKENAHENNRTGLHITFKDTKKAHNFLYFSQGQKKTVESKKAHSDAQRQAAGGNYPFDWAFDTVLKKPGLAHHKP